MDFKEVILSQIKLHPQQEIGYIGKKDKEIIVLLLEALNGCNGLLHLYLFNEDYPTHQNLKFKKLESYNKNFRLESRLFEQLFLVDCLDQFEDKSRILKKSFRSLENSGNLIIIQDKKDFDKNTIFDLVQNSGFVAINDIDFLKDKWIINAKKMHGWGFGI